MLRWAVYFLLCATSLGRAEGFISGADFSLLAFFEQRGVVYRDNGEVKDGLAILKQHGLNCVRLRLFTSNAVQAQANPYNYTNNLDYTLPLAVRVKSNGLRFMLDFHYSDTWADPGKQTKPVAWTNLPFAQLVQKMQEYNSNCIAAFKLAGAMPDYVQVGNEITSGLLWPEGRVGTANDSAQWPQLGQLLKAAIQGIRDASGTTSPLIIVHLDRGGDWDATKWFFDNLAQQGVAFDIIGESYYPWWHGSFASLARCLTNAASQYHKPVLIAETAFPWTNSYWTTNIYGLLPSPGGQVQFVVALSQVLKNLPLELTAGVCWWGTEYQQVSGVSEAGFNTASFFDSNGNLLPVADAVGQLAAPVLLSASLSNSVLTLRWPLSGARASLKTATSLDSGTVWTPVTNAPQNTNAFFTLTLPWQGGLSRFYRLISN